MNNHHRQALTELGLALSLAQTANAQVREGLTQPHTYARRQADAYSARVTHEKLNEALQLLQALEEMKGAAV